MNWLLGHYDTLRESLLRLAQQPFATLLNVLVIGIAISLPAGFYIGLNNVQTFSRQLSSDPQISVFMTMDAAAADIADVEQRLRNHPDVGRFEYVSRDRALERLKRSAGLADVLADLGRNPLPDAFVLTARNNDPAILEGLRSEAVKWSKVEHVQLDAEWARRLDAALGVGRLLVSLLGALLAMALVAITFNTIRLQILTQRAEIEISKLIGATDAFIRRPFFYLGALQGLAGGGVALAILAASLAALNVGVSDLASSYGSSFRLVFLGPGDALAVLLFSALLGWLGAYLSVSKYLLEIEQK
ncbi:MAG TPA: permease-like cell division protein FtsX [Burkholderiales bacterium]|nr:permease-like cell division protein FtsX [Burkholderiales bacterium]